jgi:hypothetical protein
MPWQQSNYAEAWNNQAVILQDLKRVEALVSNDRA